MSDDAIEMWKTKMDQVQVIGQAELFPILIIRLTWTRRLTTRRVIWFIDNDRARLGLIKAYSPVLPSLDIISRCLGWDHVNNCSSWFASVSSDANIGDAPSRMDPKPLVEKYGARIVKPISLDGFLFADVLDCGSDTDSRDSPFKTRTQNMHMLCTRNSGELVLGELQGVIIKIHVMQLRVVNFEVL